MNHEKWLLYRISCWCQVASLFVLAGCASSTPSMKDVQEWPFLSRGKGMILTEIPGTQRSDFFLLDSGSIISQLSPDFLERHLGEFQEIQVRFESSGSELSEKLYHWSFNYGLPETLLVTAKLSNLRKYHSRVDGFDCCSGILGLDFFKRYAIEVNHDRARVYFKKSYRDLPKAEWFEIPILFNERQQKIQMVCDSSLGPRLTLDLDTGLEFPLILSEKFAKDHQLQRKLMGKLVTLKRNAFYVDLGHLKCGEFRSNFPVSGLSLTAVPDGAIPEVEGRIGVAVFGKNFVIDLHAGKLWVRKDGISVLKPNTLNQVYKVPFQKKVQSKIEREKKGK